MDFNDICKKYDVRILAIPVSRNDCEEARRKCSECPFRDTCDYNWVADLWTIENKTFKKDTLLGPLNPAFVKPDFRSSHVLTVGNDRDNFCCFNNPRSRDYVVVGDIYVDSSARGKGISKKILGFLMEMSDKDVFAKCVAGTSAESFWSHVGYKVNDQMLPDSNWLEIREGKRDLAWYRVENKNKTAVKEDLW